MSSLSFHSLPAEVWSQILACLFPRFHDQASTSLVSKDFQLLALPHLYNALCLDHPTYLEQLAPRVAVDDTSALSIRPHVKSLFIGRWLMDIDQTGRESKKDMGLLKTIVSALPHIRHLTLELVTAPEDRDLWEILRAKCTELRSFELFMLTAQSFFYEARNARILDFRNLSHFSFSTGHIDFHFEGATLEPLLLPLRNSPNLESLELTLDAYPKTIFWLPNELFSALDDITFPHLHTFRVLGDIDPRFYISFKGYRSNSLGRFFSRHSGLRTLTLDCSPSASNYAFGPQVAEVLFPLLTHLEAPYFVCGSVMASKLADQLEDLKIKHITLTPDASVTAKTLPKLRKLGIEAQSTDLSTLEKLLRCAPGIEELVCGWQFETPDEILPVMSLLPELCILSLKGGPLGTSKEDVWEKHVPAFAEKCPKLRRMNRLLLRETSWVISRGEDGRVAVMQYD